MNTRPANSPGQYFAGLALGLSLLLGSGLVLLVAGIQNNNNLGLELLFCGPVMLLVALLFTRSRSLAYGVGLLTALGPGLLFGVFLFLSLLLSHR